MSALQQLLDDPQTYDALVDDCAALVENRLQTTQGLSGRTLRLAFKAANRANPGLVRRATVWLLPQFVDALEPMYQRSLAAESPLSAYLTTHRDEAAERLLAVTDERIGTIRNPVVRQTYSRLRKQAQSHVEAALPELSLVLNRYLGDAV